MKKIAFWVILSGIVVLNSCKSDSCKGVDTYPQFDSEMINYFFKTGSFWVYRDSTDGITDSLYVYAYGYRTHYRNPLDTPQPYYQYVSPGGATASTYCGPYYRDSAYMLLGSVRNGTSYDTLNFMSPGSDDVTIYGHDRIYNGQNSVTGFFLNWTKVGFLNCCDAVFFNGSSYDTTGSWYQGVQPSVVSGDHTFSNVSLWTVVISDGSCPRFAFKTDLYIARGNGIIKIVQHKPTGDVKWDLINYHISN